jgi:hypothetical protein
MSLPDIPSDNRALSVLSLKSSNLRVDGGKALVAGLKGNQVISELNIADNKLGVLASQGGWTKEPGKNYCSPTGKYQQEKPAGVELKPLGIIALADAIPSMRAISTVIVNTFPLPIQDIKLKAELDFSGKELKGEDIVIIAALIPSNVSHKPYISLLLSLISLFVTRGR